MPDPVMAPLVQETFELYGAGKFPLMELADHMYAWAAQSAWRTGHREWHLDHSQ